MGTVPAAKRERLTEVHKAQTGCSRCSQTWCTAALLSLELEGVLRSEKLTAAVTSGCVNRSQTLGWSQLENFLFRATLKEGKTDWCFLFAMKSFLTVTRSDDHLEEVN